MSLSGILNTHVMAANLLEDAAAPTEQKAALLPRLATGEIRGCLSLSEPDAGTDTSALKCRAERDGDEYVITGTKTWVTNGERAGPRRARGAHRRRASRASWSRRSRASASAAITVSRNIRKLGYKGLETVEMSYDGHRVPADARARRRGRARARAALHPLGARGRPHQHRGARRAASRAPRSRPRSATRSSARRSASRSRSTRRSR